MRSSRPADTIQNSSFLAPTKWSSQSSSQSWTSAKLSHLLQTFSSTSYSFISLTAHGINNDWKRVKYVLAIRELPGRHTGHNINLAIKEILQEWELKNERCHVFLRDGAANMKKAFEGEFQHVDCGAHKLNLAVKSAISNNREAEVSTEVCLTKCRKIAGHFASSNLAKDRLCEIQKDLNIEMHQVKQDVATRWNSTLDMAERFLQQKRPIEIYFARWNPPSDAKNPIANEWELLKQLSDLLESADASTRDMRKDDSHIGMQIVVSQMLLEKLRSTNVPKLLVEKDLLIDKLQALFSGLENDRNYGLALFLDPRFKDRIVDNSDWFRRHIKNWLTTQFSASVEVVNEEIQAAQELSEEPIAKKPRSLLARQPVMNRIEIVSTPNTWIQNLEYEISSYNAEITEPMTSDPLIYWQKNVIRFPILSKAAPQFLATPSTSVASEQLFSRARDVFHYKRNLLDPFSAEQLIFLNKSLEIVNFTY